MNWTVGKQSEAWISLESSFQLQALVILKHRTKTKLAYNLCYSDAFL